MKKYLFLMVGMLSLKALIILGFFGSISIMLYAIQFLTQDYVSKTFRVTYQFEFDGKPVSGSSVLRVDAHSNFQFFPGVPASEWSTRGEATPVPVGSAGTLFLLPPNYPYIFDCATMLGYGHEQMEGLRNYSGKCETRNRSRVVLREPWQTAEQLTVLLLPDFLRTEIDTPRITNMHVYAETTRDDLSTGIESQFPWIAELPSPIGGMTDPRVIYKADLLGD